MLDSVHPNHHHRSGSRSPKLNNHGQRPCQVPLPSLDVGLTTNAPVSSEARSPPHPLLFQWDVSHFFRVRRRNQGGRNLREAQQGGGPSSTLRPPSSFLPLTSFMSNASVMNDTTRKLLPAPHAPHQDATTWGGLALRKPIAAYGATIRHRKPHSEHGNHVEMQSQRHCPAEGLRIPGQNNHPTDAWNADVDDTTMKA